MKKIKLTKKNIGITLIGILIFIQIIRIDKTNLKVYPPLDFISITKPNNEITSLLKNACYDCHSNEVKYPWYTNIAPVSWWIKHHINEGSHHLNFSIWGTYKSRRMDHKLKECIEMIEEGEMPMYSYTIMHSESKLSKAQQELLINWFKSLRTFESDKPKKD